jgi:tetratricopeptide (TPR) repeat protein
MINAISTKVGGDPAKSLRNLGAQRNGPSKGSGSVGGELKASIDSVRQHIRERNFAEASNILDRIFEENPDFPPAYLFMGVVYAAKAEYDQAIEYFEGALHLNKDMPVALMLLGGVYAKKGMFDKALQKFRSAIALKPTLEKAHIDSARVYQKTGRPEEAMECLRQALERNPQSEQARIAMSGLFREQGRIDDAKKELEGILQVNEDSWHARVLLARLMTGPSEGQRAVQLLSEAAQLKPEGGKIKFLLGKKCFELGRYDDALRAFSAVVESAPENVLAQVEVARVKAAQGHLADARRILIQLSKGKRSLGAVHRCLAEVFVKEGRYSEAVAEFRAIVVGNEKVAKQHPELGAALEVKGSDEDIAKGCLEAFARAVAAGRDKGNGADDDEV